MNLLKFTKNDQDYMVSLSFGFYSNDNIAVCLNAYEDGYFVPYATATVNINKVDKFTGYLDTNNLTDSIVNFVIENGLGELTGNYANSGFCTYPEVKFYEEKLRMFDEDFWETFDNL